MSSLAPRHRCVVTMWMRGLRPAEIARDLGIKRNAADALLHRARRQLATKLEPSRATLGIIGIAILKLRIGMRRLVDGVSSIDPSGSVVQATAGLATVGIAALLIAASPEASTHTTIAPRDEAPAASVSGETPAVGGSATKQAGEAVKEVHRAVSEYRFATKTQVFNPVTGKPDDVTLDLWYFDDGEKGVVDSLLEPTAKLGCEVGLLACAGVP